MRRSFAALVAAGIAALWMVTGTAAASAAPANAQTSFTFVIDQFATRGPNGQADQYIQIKNVSSVRQDLSNFTVMGAPTPANIFNVATIPQGTIMQPGDVYVIANAQGYSGPVVDQFFVSALRLPDMVGVALMSPANAMVDAVATVASSPFVMGAPAAPLTTDRPLALVRFTNTGKNAVDFHIAPRTPGLPGPDPLF